MSFVELSFFAAFLGVALWAIWFAVSPLAGRQRAGPSQTSPAEKSDGHAAIDALAELELDYRLGALGWGDYAAQRQMLEAEITAMRRSEKDRQEALRELLEELVESGVASRRRALREAGVVVGMNGTRGEAGEKREAATPVLGALEEAEPLPGPDGVSPGARQGPVWRGRRLRWLAGGTAAAAAFLLLVSWLYFSSPIQATQEPLATLPPGQYRSILVSPADSLRLLLASDQGLLGSTDGGKSWALLPLDGTVTALAASQGPRPVLYAAGRGLLARSQDGGLSWEPLPLDGAASQDVVALAALPGGDGLLMFTQDGRLYASREAGQVWELFGEKAPPGTTSVIPVTGQRMPFFLASRDQGVLAGDGRSWTSANGFVNGALPTLRTNGLAFDSASGDRYISPDGSVTAEGALYVATDAGLFKSVDGGSSWTRLPFRGPVQTVAVDPGNGETLYVVDGQGRVFRSRDRGLTWKASS